MGRPSTSRRGGGCTTFEPRKPHRHSLGFSPARAFLPDGKYAADITGYLVSIVNFDLTVIDIPELASSSNETLEWSAILTPRPEWAPRSAMIIEPVGNAAPAPAAAPATQPASPDAAHSTLPHSNPRSHPTPPPRPPTPKFRPPTTTLSSSASIGSRSSVRAQCAAYRRGDPLQSDPGASRPPAEAH